MGTLALVLATSRKPPPPPHSIAPAEICTQMDGQPSYWVVLTTTKHSNSFARASARFALAAPLMCLLPPHAALWVSEIFSHHFSACLLLVVCFLAGSAYVLPGEIFLLGCKVVAGHEHFGQLFHITAMWPFVPQSSNQRISALQFLHSSHLHCHLWLLAKTCCRRCRFSAPKKVLLVRCRQADFGGSGGARALE